MKKFRKFPLRFKLRWIILRRYNLAVFDFVSQLPPEARRGMTKFGQVMDKFGVLMENLYATVFKREAKKYNNLNS